MLNEQRFSFKNLLAEIPKDGPVDLGWLRARGVRDSYAAKLAKSGYLEKLGAGAYCLKGVKLEQDASLAWLQHRFPDMHVASKSALALRGIRQNIARTEQLILLSVSQFKVPVWFLERFPVRNHAVRIFENQLGVNVGISSVPGKPAAVRVSEPERALLELFSEVGTWVSYDDARNLTENARNLRLDVLEHLLAHCTRIKIVRLAHKLTQELGLPWENIAKQHSERLGGSDRWVLSRQDGLETMTLRK